MEAKWVDRSPQAVQACHELLLWMIPLLQKFPRSHRFTLGERMENVLLAVLESLVAAAYSASSEKQTLLKRANTKLEILRHLWRLAFELKIIPVRRFEHGAKLMDQLGRQIGGWLRSRRTSS